MIYNKVSSNIREGNKSDGLLLKYESQFNFNCYYNKTMHIKESFVFNLCQNVCKLLLCNNKQKQCNCHKTIIIHFFFAYKLSFSLLYACRHSYLSFIQCLFFIIVDFKYNLKKLIIISRFVFGILTYYFCIRKEFDNNMFDHK